MIRCFFLVIGCTLATVSQCCADIAFLAFNADNNDDFAVVALQDFTAGTSFRFSDNEWNGSTGFNTGEGNFTFTTSSAVSIGTILRFNNVGVNGSRSVTTGTGASVAGTFSGATSMALGASEEAIYAYFGPNDGTISTQLASIRTNTTAGSGNLFTSGNNLTLGPPFNGDIWVYTGNQSFTGLTVADAINSGKAALTDLSNWTLQGDGAGNQTYTPPGGSFSFSAVPEPASMLLLGVAGVGGIAFRRFRRKSVSETIAS